MTKEELERASFQTFLRIGGISVDRFESAKPPEPDIVAYSGASAIGVEITTFHRDEEKRRESEEDKLIVRAQQLYETLRLPCLGVRFHWVGQIKFGRKDRDRLAKKITHVVSRHVPQLNEVLELDWNAFDPELQRLLHSVTLDRLVDYRRNSWQAPRAAFVGKWTPELLQGELDRKALKPQFYRGRYAEIWLLIVSRFDSPSGWLQMTDATQAALYSTPYNRAFLISSFPQEVYELRLRK